MPTTIQIMEKTKTKLEQLKEYPRETYDETVNKLIELSQEDHLEYTKETKEGLKRAYDDLKNKRFCTTKQLIEELGI